MPGKYVHRIAASDPNSTQVICSILKDLQQATIRSHTPIGLAVSFVISSWRQDESGAFLIQFSPLVAERLSALTGIELLEAAQGMANVISIPAEDSL